MYQRDWHLGSDKCVRISAGGGRAEMFENKDAGPF